MTKAINLALQGGGAHGAYTWGVLDRLLLEPELEIAAITGTSAGALNGAAVKAGLAQGSAQAARDNLDWLWEQMGAARDPELAHWLRLFAPDPAAVSHALALSPGFQFSDALGRLTSPYAVPGYRNPLRAVVQKFDFDKLCDSHGPRFFICATNVRSGKIKVFQGDQISTQAVLASACLPTLFRAVEITDPATGITEAYWDGGYSGNPALFPLFEPDLPRDVVIVNINPLYREELPITPQDIHNRINEISFNSSLLRELRAISFVQRLLETGAVADGAMKHMLVHMIADDDLMQKLSVATKMVPIPSIMADLKAAGQRAAERFLNDNFDQLGQRSTVDIEKMFR
jgi:NTE family protein